MKPVSSGPAADFEPEKLSGARKEYYILVFEGYLKVPETGFQRLNLASDDGNGHSHLQATLLGPSLTVPIKEGRLVLGTWQQVFHLECDIKPRHRTLTVTVMGET